MSVGHENLVVSLDFRTFFPRPETIPAAYTESHVGRNWGSMRVTKVPTWDCAFSTSAPLRASIAGRDRIMEERIAIGSSQKILHWCFFLLEL